MFWFASSA
jgi:hypothetical protein